MTCTKTAVCVISFSNLNNNQVLGVHSTGQHSMISSVMCPHCFTSKSKAFWRQRSNTDYDISYLKKHWEQIIPAIKGNICSAHMGRRTCWGQMRCRHSQPICLWCAAPHMSCPGSWPYKSLLPVVPQSYLSRWRRVDLILFSPSTTAII